MSIENVTTALQVNATTGNGQTLVLREPRLVTFSIKGNGPVTAGAVTIESSTGKMTAQSGQTDVGTWTALITIAVPANKTIEHSKPEEPSRSWAFGLRNKKAGAAAHYPEAPTKPGLRLDLFLPIIPWHDSAHEFVEQRDGKGSVTMAWTPNHALCDQLIASWA
jgi:hypothetical protein